MENSEVLASLRDRGRNPLSEGLAYLEWSAPDDAASDDPEAWYQAKPGLGVRISEDHVRTEMVTLGDDEFRRERLEFG
jgi:phage terminase large subunit-like protein